MRSWSLAPIPGTPSPIFTPGFESEILYSARMSFDHPRAPWENHRSLKASSKRKQQAPAVRVRNCTNSAPAAGRKTFPAARPIVHGFVAVASSWCNRSSKPTASSTINSPVPRSRKLCNPVQV